MVAELNWAGNYRYRASTIHHPETLDELRAVVSRARQIRALGTRHCFTDIADSSELVCLDSMPVDLVISDDRTTVTVGGGVRYGELAVMLHDQGLALHNMASLPHISVAGSIATGTHGSGFAHGSLATAVAGIELVTADGDTLQINRGDPDFDGVLVGLGALGVVTRVTLDVQPTYEVQQDVFEHLPWENVLSNFDQIMSCAYSVSMFTHWGADLETLWIKHRMDADSSVSRDGVSWGGTPSPRDRHPVLELPAAACTPQMGVPGAWHDRLPHFRLDSVPASGEEIQAEYMVAQADGVAAIRALQAISDQFTPHLSVTEIRTAAADNLWLSSAYETPVVCIHFSFKPDQGAVNRLLPIVEAVLEPFSPRPHWGKAFAATAADLEPRYPRMKAFRQLMKSYDPNGTFHNDFIRRHILG